MKLKPWQIALFVIAALVCVGSLAYMTSTSGEVKLNTTVHAIDVETGDIYAIDINKYPLMLPARHPTTGKIQLVRVTKDDAGNWAVTGRDLQTLDQLDQGVKITAVDPESGRLTAPAKPPKTYSRTY